MPPPARVNVPGYDNAKKGAKRETGKGGETTRLVPCARCAAVWCVPIAKRRQNVAKTSPKRRQNQMTDPPLPRYSRVDSQVLRRGVRAGRLGAPQALVRGDEARVRTFFCFFSRLRFIRLQTLLAGTDRRTRAARPSFRSGANERVRRRARCSRGRPSDTRGEGERREGRGARKIADARGQPTRDGSRERLNPARRDVGRAPPLGAVSRRFQHSRRSGDSRPTAILAPIAYTTVLADLRPTAILALRAPTTVLAD